MAVHWRNGIVGTSWIRELVCWAISPRAMPRAYAGGNMREAGSEGEGRGRGGKGMRDEGMKYFNVYRQPAAKLWMACSFGERATSRICIPSQAPITAHIGALRL